MRFAGGRRLEQGDRKSVRHSLPFRSIVTRKLDKLERLALVNDTKNVILHSERARNVACVECPADTRGSTLQPHITN